MLKQLYASADDFSASVDQGIALISETHSLIPPDKEDEPDMKSLLSVFITATIDMDPASVDDPHVAEKLTSVRMALLAAYNLGKRAEKKNQT